MYSRPLREEHSSLSNRLEHGEHKGYVPGEFDPTTGIHNPTQRGLVRGWFTNPERVDGPEGHLANLREFTGHSIRGVWVLQSSGYTAYVVYSYATPIAYYQPPKNQSIDPAKDLYEDFWIDYDSYGHITRTHQGMVLAWMGQAMDNLKGIDPRVI